MKGPPSAPPLSPQIVMALEVSSTEAICSGLLRARARTLSAAALEPACSQKMRSTPSSWPQAVCAPPWPGKGKQAVRDGQLLCKCVGRLASAGGTESIAGEGWTQPAGMVQPEPLIRALGIMAGVLGLPSPCGCLCKSPPSQATGQSTRDLGLSQRGGRV